MHGGEKGCMSVYVSLHAGIIVWVYLGTVTHLLSYYKFCVNVCECMLMKDCIICVSCFFNMRVHVCMLSVITS